MWNAIGDLLKEFLQHCVVFDEVNSSADFVRYIKRCQIKTSLFFNGSTDKPLDEQLKALYVKQAFIHFAYLSDHFRYEAEGGAIKLQDAFKRFVNLIDIKNFKVPSWPVATQSIPVDIELSVKAIIDNVQEADK